MCNNIKTLLLVSLKRRWIRCSIVLVTIAFITLGTNIAIVELFRRMTNALLNVDFNQLFYNFILFCIVAAGVGVLTIAQKNAFFFIQKECIYRLSDKLCESYMCQAYWENEESIVIQTHLQKVIPETVASLLVNVKQSVITAFAVVSGVWYGITINPLAVIICVLLTCVMVFISSYSLAKTPEAYKQFVKGTKNVRGLLSEQIHNREIGGFLRQDRVLSGYEKENKAFIKNLLSIKKISNGADLFSMFGSTILIVVIALIGGYSIIQGAMQIADLLALILVIPSVASCLFGIPALITQLRGVIAKLKEIAILLQKPAYQNDGKQKIDGVNQIVIQHLHYQYPNQSDNTIKDVSISLDKGLWCIAGASGCGKSTLLKLIAALLPPKDGIIYINDSPLHQIDRRNYWDLICYMDQCPVILAGSLIFNITMTYETPDMDRLAKVIDDAGLTDWVNNRPEGLNALIDNKTLSKGEIQRVNFARAFYRKSDIYLMDEWTEGLDPGIELSMLNALRKIALERELLVICTSHRKSVLEGMQHIIFMNNGVVDQIDTHENLLKTNVSYRMLMEVV